MLVRASVFLVTVHDPICTESGSLEAALYGSFLPIPPVDIFAAHEPSTYARENLPGAIIAKRARIVLNEGRKRVKLLVTNNGDRPIQVRLSTDQYCKNINIIVEYDCTNTDRFSLPLH